MSGEVVAQASSGGRDEGYWTFEAVEDRLVEAVRAWWHCEAGRWPFAGDGPWFLADSELYGPDVDKDAPAPRVPLTRGEVAARDEACGWLIAVTEADRRIVVLGVMQLAAGNKRISWKRMRQRLDRGPELVQGQRRVGERGLGQRYTRAIGAIARRLNAE